MIAVQLGIGIGTVFLLTSHALSSGARARIERGSSRPKDQLDELRVEKDAAITETLALLGLDNPSSSRERAGHRPVMLEHDGLAARRSDRVPRVRRPT